jgi:hypothetical protein
VIEDPVSDVSVTFARNQERAMAATVTGRMKRELAPMLNELSLFTRAATFGDTNDLYYHAPSNRIGGAANINAPAGYRSPYLSHAKRALQVESSCDRALESTVSTFASEM